LPINISCMRKLVVWVERLRIFEILLFLTLGIFRDISIRYDEESLSKEAKRLLGSLKGNGFAHIFCPINLSLEKRTVSGNSLTYMVDDYLRICLGQFSKRHLSQEPSRIVMMIECYLAGILKKRVSFITCVEEEITDSEKMKATHILLLRKEMINEIIIDFYSGRGFLVKESIGSISWIKDIIRPFYLIALFIGAIIIKKETRSNLSDVRDSIWIEYDDGVDSFVDTSFWRRHVKKEAWNIVFYLDRIDTPCNDETIKKIENKGYPWVDFHDPISFVSLSDYSLTYLKDTIKKATSKTGPLWLRLFWMQYFLMLAAYGESFKVFKVRMIVQNRDTSWIQEIQRQAVAGAGGIMMGTHWSNFPCIMSPLHLFPHHVYFVWGKIFRDVMVRGENSCDYILPSGLWIQSDDRSVEKLRELKTKVKFCVSLFDSSFAYNIHLTPRSLSEFYLRIIDIIEKNGSWGAVVKSKNSNIKGLLSLPGGGEIVNRLEALLNSGRLLILDSSVSPLTVSEYTDLSLCFGLNSAGIVVGARGARAIHWDCSGWTMHPIYRDPSQNIIYRTLDEFEKAIMRAGAGDTSIGDFSKWRKEYDYYCDDEAGKRVGDYVGHYMETVIRTDDPQKSLVGAVNKYISENGVGDEFMVEKNNW
jgi:hypothetical protein